jgi:isoleucyl-tRNA synthetase
MSKSLGNYTDAMPTIEAHGADAVRLYILGSNFMKCETISFDKDGKVFSEPVKNILTPLWNAYHFFTLYANSGGITHSPSDGPARQSDGGNMLDQYILAEFDSLRIAAGGALDDYAPDAAVKEFVKFLDILNNWYIRRSRTRFWNEEQGAFDTLHFVLTEFCKLLAPFAPFASDYIYRNLTGAESVHLEKFPDARARANSRNGLLLEQMRRVQQIVATGKMLREKYGLRNRLPLGSITVAGKDLSDFADIIRDELNVKSVIFTDNVADAADSFAYLITPKIGARLGSALKEIIPAVKSGNYKIDNGRLTTGDYQLNADEFEIRLTVKPGIKGAALPDNTAVVILDTALTPELVAEGLANDALRFIQDTRKAMNLDVSDRIALEFSGDPELIHSLETHRARIMAEALITDLRIGAGDEFHTEIEGHKFGIKITKI